MSDWSVEKRPCTHGWANRRWAWGEFARYAWAGNLMRSQKDWIDLWLNRDAYIARYLSPEEVAARDAAQNQHD